VCCDFCDVVFHATCIPALRPHLPPAGLACVECFADSFPDQRAAYDRLFYQRPPVLPVSTSLDSLPVQSSIPPVLTTSDVALPISASLDALPVQPSVSPVLSPSDASLTLAQSISTDTVTSRSSFLPTPRDIRASRRREDGERNSRARATEPAVLSMGIGADAGADAGGVASTSAGASVGADAHISAAVAPVLRASPDVAVDMNMCVSAQPDIHTVAAAAMHADLRPDASARIAPGTDARTAAGAAAGAGAADGVSTASFSAPTIQVWIKRATSSPAWLSLMMELRQFHDSFDLFSHCGSFPHMPSAASPVALANLSPYVD
jgi:hypothetical protein